MSLFPSKKGPPPRPKSESESLEQGRKNSAAIRGTTQPANPSGMTTRNVDVEIEFDNGEKRIIGTRAASLAGAIATAGQGLHWTKPADRERVVSIRILNGQLPLPVAAAPIKIRRPQGMMPANEEK